MSLIHVKALKDFPSGVVEEVVNGGATYAVCNVEGKLHCVEGTCPHAGGPLGQGNLHGNYIVCPLHGWEFDTRTGLNQSDEDVALATFPVVVQDGNVLIDVP